DGRPGGEMDQQHRWAQATTALQIAIAMAAIALLTKRDWLQYAMYGVAALGGGLGLLAVRPVWAQSQPQMPGATTDINAVEPRRCANCGAALSGRYCAKCGQDSQVT